MSLLRQMPESLSDGVVLLDAHRIEDAEAHLRGEDAEMRRRFDAPRPATLDETLRAIERWIAGRAGGEPMFAYALRNLSGLLIGGCELRMRSVDSANISYWVFPRFRGRGHAVRMVALLYAAAGQVPGIRRLELRVSADNQQSRRVAEKAGFIETGTVEEKTLTGTVSTMLLYVKDLL
jgi:Acetyltransferases, including N-acetylases of ribosomal proteins